jgi:uncharacterized membrane protein
MSDETRLQTDGDSPPDTPPEAPPPEAASAADDAVWTYRGYKLSPSDFTTAMVHMFRAEINRANVWRQRLDATTNWAVITTGAAISFAFGSRGAGNHGVIILNTLLVTIFLSIEARRYRYYELWSYRVRLMETDFFTPMLVSPFRPAADWAESLAESLLHPTFPISTWEAFGRRYRRNYVWIYALMSLAWIMNIWLYPEPPASSISEMIDRADIGTIPGWVVWTTGIAVNAALLAVGVLTAGLQGASGEVLPRYGTLAAIPGLWSGASGGEGAKPVRAWFRSSRKRAQLLTYIITDRADAVSERILREMYRGVTALPGVGMYTGKKHSVLMVALTVTEIPQLEALVREQDPTAFVIVSPVQEVFGSGFVTLQERQAES